MVAKMSLICCEWTCNVRGWPANIPWSMNTILTACCQQLHQSYMQLSANVDTARILYPGWLHYRGKLHEGNHADKLCMQLIFVQKLLQLLLRASHNFCVKRIFVTILRLLSSDVNDLVWYRSFIVFVSKENHQTICRSVQYNYLRRKQNDAL